MLNRLRNYTSIDEKRVVQMNAERMEQRQRFARMAAKAGFDVGIDDEAPIKVDVEKNLLGFRMHPHPGGCTAKTLIVTAGILLFDECETSPEKSEALKSLYMAIRLLAMAEKRRYLEATGNE